MSIRICIQNDKLSAAVDKLASDNTANVKSQ